MDFIASYLSDDVLYGGGLLAVGLVLFFLRHFAGRLCDDIYDYIKRKLGFTTQAQKAILAQQAAVQAVAAPLPKAASQETVQSQIMAAATIVSGNGSKKDRVEGGVEVETKSARYALETLLATGDIAHVYDGEVLSGPNKGERIAVKVALNSADNDLIQNEVRILKTLNEDPREYGKHLAKVLDQFKTASGQLGTVMSYLDGLDLHVIREKYRSGIPHEHIIWLFRRTLSALGYAHSVGIIHGNVDPAHILVSPKDHNVFLVDWCYGIFNPSVTGEGFRCVNETYSAPEVAERRPPIPAADLYSVGKCMVYALGGDVNTLEMPLRVDERIRRFIQFFTRESPLQRAQDAWEMYRKLDELREEIFGPHKFIEFEM